MAVRARIWGCRGSLPTPGARTVRYGGNTACVEVAAGVGRLVLDAGTGIKALGATLSAEEPIHVLLTHLHLDHVEGLRFFAPLWDPRCELHVWGPPSPLFPLRERIARAFSPPLFPLELTDSPAHVTFHDVPREPWELGEITIAAQPVSHPGPTLGFRLEAGGRALAYIPDHEPVLGLELGALEPEWISGYALAAGADLLLHDCQLTEAEYPTRVGWGHSSVAHAVALAQRAEVGRLVLFHHDPDRGDDEVELLGARARELWGGGRGEPPLAAYEGMTIEL
ncbi:MAG TPA: MBL fold metallo-hydrolase [Gaiellaceae bacterium]|nr:MBL fold metallo-hydrolase [Gaiellaceae bacterium]